MSESGIEILASGTKFIGKGVRAISSVIEENMAAAKTEICIITFTFTSNKICTLIEKALERGVKIELMINHLDEQPEIIRDNLRKLSNKYNYFVLKSFNEKNGILHAKVFIFDRKVAIVGSANLSMSAMEKNYEMALLVKGEPVTQIYNAIKNIIN